MPKSRGAARGILFERRACASLIRNAGDVTPLPPSPPSNRAGVGRSRWATTTQRSKRPHHSPDPMERPDLSATQWQRA